MPNPAQYRPETSPLQRAAAKAARAREKEQQQDFHEYIDTRAGTTQDAQPSSCSEPTTQTEQPSSSLQHESKSNPNPTSSSTPDPKPAFQSVDWAEADKMPSGTGAKNERGGYNKLNGEYEPWHMTFEPLRRCSTGFAAWGCIQFTPAHYSTECYLREERCESDSGCGHFLAPGWGHGRGVGMGSLGRVGLWSATAKRSGS
jgi:hypothetical protein